MKNSRVPFVKTLSDIKSGKIHDECSLAYQALTSAQVLELVQTINKHNQENENKIIALDLSGTGINDAAAETLSCCTLLQTLVLDSNEITFIGATHLATMENLRHLDLADNHVGNRGSYYLARTQLEFLDLESNGVTDVGAKCLATSKTLKTLHLERNEIADPGAIQLSLCTTLENLYVDYNHIGQSGLTALSTNLAYKHL